ncbi:hypothetical protein G6L37_07410 [Agrobacterium rubi]|nr:hypothetical protein [Agrobacterium rubi]NTF25195.1 hypothetical protein [Agrobacterium rubi]
MTYDKRVLMETASGRELVLTSDPVNPYALRIDGAVIVQSWSRALMEQLIDSDAFFEVAAREIDKD